jgi:outer membrane protein TolC
MKNKILIIFTLLFFSGAVNAQQLFTLEEYLKQVEQNNPQIKAINLYYQSIGNKVLEADMTYSPYLNGTYNMVQDKSGSGFGDTLPMEKVDSNSWSISANKKFITGTTLSLGYADTTSKLNLTEPTTIFPNYTTDNFKGYQLNTFLKFEQSLLRDFGSHLTSSGIKKSKALVKAEQYLQLYQKQQLLIQAKSAYWSLSLAREIIIFRTLSLERADKLLKWNTKRLALNLAENKDFLESQASDQLRQLNLQFAKEDEVRLNRTFNELMGLSSDKVDYDLEKIYEQASFYDPIENLNKTGERKDVLASRAVYESAELADKETFYRSLPELTLNGSLSYKGLGLDRNTSWTQVQNGDKPVYAVGVSFLVPLDYGTLSKVKKGYKEDFYSAKEKLAKAELSSQNDWNNLLITWKNIKSRLRLAKEIKNIQEKRVENEQLLFQKGRTTSFQVITAENDLTDATLQMYQIMYEQIMAYAQQELYN